MIHVIARQKKTSACLLDRDPDEPEKTFTENEIKQRLARVLNDRLTTDRMLINRLRYGSKALPQNLVLSTWSGTLKNKKALPTNWLHQKTGVLVGITPDNPRKPDR